MYSALSLFLSATGTPEPQPTLNPSIDPNDVTPGAIGFFVTAAVVIIAILLMLDMVRRIRRIRYREMAEQKLLAQQEAKNDGDASNQRTSPEPSPPAKK